MKITFKLNPNFINQYKGREWVAYINNNKTNFSIEKITKEYYNYLNEDNPLYKKNSEQSYAVYESDETCLDGFCQEFLTLQEAKHYIKEILQERNTP